jgi:hypothetical protein
VSRERDRVLRWIRIIPRERERERERILHFISEKKKSQRKSLVLIYRDISVCEKTYMSDLHLPLSTTSSTFSTSNVEDGENFDRAISNKAPFDFGLDIFTSPSKTTTGLSTSSTQQQQSLLKQSLMHTDTATTSSVSSAQLNFVKPKSTTAATLVGKPDSSSMDSSDVDNGPRPGDWQVHFTHFSNTHTHTHTHTHTYIHTYTNSAQRVDAEMLFLVDATEVVSTVSFVVHAIQIWILKVAIPLSN